MKFVRVIINLFQFNRTNWKAVILCVLAAATFWIFNAFNKSHSSTIRFPLHFDFDNQRYVAVKPLPQQININVTASGWELFRKSMGVKLPELIISLDRPLEIKKIPASGVVPLVIDQLGSLQLNYITTDTLHIHLDEKVSKIFRLKADLSNLKLKEGFGFMGVVEVIPDTVVIDGPRSIIKSLPDTISLPILAKGISKSFSDEVEIPLFDSESINRNPPVVAVKIEVGPMETMETTLKLKVIHQLRKGKAFADSVKAFIQIPVNQKEDFISRRADISALIDLKEASQKSQQLFPKIIGLPVYARVISIDSMSYKID